MQLRKRLVIAAVVLVCLQVAAANEEVESRVSNQQESAHAKLARTILYEADTDENQKVSIEELWNMVGRYPEARHYHEVKFLEDNIARVDEDKDRLLNHKELQSALLEFSQTKTQLEIPEPEIKPAITKTTPGEEDEF
eukprot:TRINITY_DN51033_c0_g1_i1.p1 TRINITY_DN51033_c0_g1~~TRINITY_DN51033_c0_g1_i1.p1  ORF type:complete len:138 (-),score=33.88 TRINITY_DN51033_c0_g1_i1:82-495(-)